MSQVDLRPHFVYLLASQNPNSHLFFYIGYTVNPLRRLRQHNGELRNGAKATKRTGRPWHLVCFLSGFVDHRTALSFEFTWQYPYLPKENKPLMLELFGPPSGVLSKATSRSTGTGSSSNLKKLDVAIATLHVLLCRHPLFSHAALTLHVVDAALFDGSRSRLRRVLLDGPSATQTDNRPRGPTRTMVLLTPPPPLPLPPSSGLPDDPPQPQSTLQHPSASSGPPLLLQLFAQLETYPLRRATPFEAIAAVLQRYNVADSDDGEEEEEEEGGPSTQSFVSDHSTATWLREGVENNENEGGHSTQSSLYTNGGPSHGSSRRPAASAAKKRRRTELLLSQTLSQSSCVWSHCSSQPQRSVVDTMETSSQPQRPLPLLLNELVDLHTASARGELLCVLCGLCVHAPSEGYFTCTAADCPLVVHIGCLAVWFFTAPSFGVTSTTTSPAAAALSSSSAQETEMGGRTTVDVHRQVGGGEPTASGPAQRLLLRPTVAPCPLCRVQLQWAVLRDRHKQRVQRHTQRSAAITERSIDQRLESLKQLAASSRH